MTKGIRLIDRYVCTYVCMYQYVSIYTAAVHMYYICLEWKFYGQLFFLGALSFYSFWHHLGSSQQQVKVTNLIECSIVVVVDLVVVVIKIEVVVA